MARDGEPPIRTRTFNASVLVIVFVSVNVSPIVAVFVTVNVTVQFQKPHTPTIKEKQELEALQQRRSGVQDCSDKKDKKHRTVHGTVRAGRGANTPLGTGMTSPRRTP